MRGKKAKAVRRQLQRVLDLGDAWANDPSDENEAKLDAAQAELRRLRKKGEPIRA